MEKRLTIRNINAGSDTDIFYCPVARKDVVLPEGFSVFLPDTCCERRKYELLTIQYIIISVTTQSGPVKYNPDGKPLLPGLKKHISISHSAEYAAVMISEYPCGVDVEKISGRTEAVAHKYLNDSERNLISDENRDFLHTLLWSAKEALFKITGQPDFRLHMTALNLPGKEDKFIDMEVFVKEKTKVFTIFYTIFDGHVLTWTYER